MIRVIYSLRPRGPSHILSSLIISSHLVLLNSSLNSNGDVPPTIFSVTVEKFGCVPPSETPSEFLIRGSFIYIDMRIQ